jgi:hypothetical protein
MRLVRRAARRRAPPERVTEGPLDAVNPYEVRHLVQHLYGAQRGDDVHRLLSLETPAGGNALFEAKEDTADFLADVDLAHRLAAAAGRTDLRLRYALVSASIRSRSGNVPPGLLSALVDRQVLSGTAALAYARQAPDAVVRGRALAALAARLPKSDAAAVLQEALEAARAAPTRLDPPNRLDVLRAIAACPLPEAVAGGAVAIANEIESADDRAAALAMLAPALPDPRRRAVLDEALEAASTVIALAHVLPALPVDERTRLAADALERIVRVQEWHGEEYVTVTVPSNLLALAPHLSADQAASAFRAAPRIDDPEERAAVLAALAPRVDDSSRAGVLAAAREAVGKINGKWDRADALVLLGPYLSSRELRYAMRVNGLGRDKRLTQLAPNMPSREVGRYLRYARKLKSDVLRATAFSALAPHLSAEQRKQILPEAFELATRGPHLDALERLAPYLDDSQLGAALAATRIDDRDARDKALAALAPALAQARPAEALAACAALTEEHERTNRLIALAPHLPEPQLLEALEIARRSKDFLYRVRALAGVAPHLPEREREDALRDILNAVRRAPRGRPDGIAEVESVAELFRGETLRLAVEVLLRDGGQWTRTETHAEVLAALAPRVPEQLLERVLEQLGNPAEDRYPVHMLVALAPHLPEQLQPAALDAAEQLDYRATEVIVALAPRLSPALHERALEVARASRSTLALAALAPQVRNADIVAEAIQAIEDDPDADSILALANGLAANDRRLTPDCQRTLLEVVMSFESPSHRVEALDSVGPLLAGDLVEEALARARRLTDDPARVIASLAPGLPEGRRGALLDEGLENVKSLGSPESHFTLEALAPHLDDAQIEAMVAWVASDVSNSRPGPSITDTTWALTPVLTDTAFRVLLRAAVSLSDNWRLLDSLMGAADRVGLDTLNRSFSDWLASTGQRTRESTLEELAALTPALARIMPPEGIAHVADAIDDVTRWWP